jgi:hypothetical protein
VRHSGARLLGADIACVSLGSATTCAPPRSITIAPRQGTAAAAHALDARHRHVRLRWPRLRRGDYIYSSSILSVPLCSIKNTREGLFAKSPSLHNSLYTFNYIYNSKTQSYIMQCISSFLYLKNRSTILES